MEETNSKEPLVTVVLPTHNRAHLLNYAVESVLRQTHRNLELIVVDDCSADDTQTVIEGVSDPRLRYVRNHVNLKLPRTLNKGFRLAAGRFLTWTSDDNLFGETAIEMMVARLQEGDCSFVYADYFDFSDLNEVTGEPVDPSHERLPFPPALEQVNRIGACFLYTREVYEAIGDYDPELFLVEDYDYFIRISKRFGICHIAEPLYYFRRFDDSLFCSRFHEIKAADMLVRYKNGLLGKEQAVEALVSTILSNKAGLKSPFLRVFSRIAERSHWRLQAAYRRMAERHLARSLRHDVVSVLEDFDLGAATFAEAKERASESIKQVAELAFSR
jgi:glycosyltransferase involved in cell wall biosynthesis